LARNSWSKVILVYFAIALTILSAEYFFPAENEYAIHFPIFLSVLLLIPIFAWHKSYSKRAYLSDKVNGRTKGTVLLWVFALFILALSVRVPSVLLFNIPYEKTPLIYLVILTMLIVEKKHVSAFGFKTKNMGKSLLSGLLFFVLLDGFAMIFYYALVFIFTNQIPVHSYNLVPLFMTLPFMTLCVGISEEGFFRGYMQTHLEEVYPVRRAIVIQAILFGVWHFVWNLSPFDPFGMLQYVVVTFLIGLLFGYFYSKTRNLAPLVFAHGLFDSVPQGIVENISAFNVFQTISLANQILTFLLPYAVAMISTFLFVKYLARKMG
jgi:membrane protease YdiL (CAAX protease family)